MNQQAPSAERVADADCEAVERRVAECLAAIPHVTENLELLTRRREQIATAAFEEFSHVGFQSASVSSVARRAGIDKRTMYDYIGDKSDLLYLVFLTFLPGQVRRIAGALRDDDDAMTQLERMAHAHLTFLAEKPALAYLYYREMRHLARTQIDHVLWVIGQVVGLYEAAIRRGIESGVMVSGEPHVAARLVAAGCDMPSLAAWDISRYAPEVVEHEILRMLLDGLRVR